MCIYICVYIYVYIYMYIYIYITYTFRYVAHHEPAAPSRVGKLEQVLCIVACCRISRP